MAVNSKAPLEDHVISTSLVDIHRPRCRFYYESLKAPFWDCVISSFQGTLFMGLERGFCYEQSAYFTIFLLNLFFSLLRSNFVFCNLPNCIVISCCVM